MPDLSQIFTVAFLATLLASGIRFAMPIFFAALGEIVTERGGVLNLGLEGIMLGGALAGFMAAYYVEHAAVGTGGQLAAWAPWIGLLAGMAAGLAMGLFLAVLVVTLRTDQVVTSITLVIIGQGVTTYIYRQQFSSLTARVQTLPALPIPLLSDLPAAGPILFQHDAVTYLSLILLGLVLILLYKTTWGLNIRAAGEHPAAADTSGVNVSRVRYAAVLIGAALTGLGGAVITVGQLGIFNENITAGSGWIAVALVIFSRWRPQRAFLGALLFGVAQALQYRVQALNIAAIPYELLLMLPYVLTLLVLLRRSGRSAGPAALGQPYVKE